MITLFLFDFFFRENFYFLLIAKWFFFRHNLNREPMKFYMLAGLPGSGKSTTAKRLKEEENCFIISSDNFRLALNSGIYPKGDCYELLDPVVWELVERSILKLLEKGQLVGVDATNLDRDARHRWVKLVKDFNPEAEIILLWHTHNYDTPQRWERERGHNLKEYTSIRKTLEQRVEAPSEEEGFKIVYC